MKAAHVGNSQLDRIKIFGVELPAGVREFRRGDAQRFDVCAIVPLREAAQGGVATLANLPQDPFGTATDIGIIGDSGSL